MEYKEHKSCHYKNKLHRWEKGCINDTFVWYSQEKAHLSYSYDVQAEFYKIVHSESNQYELEYKIIQINQSDHNNG